MYGIFSFLCTSCFLFTLQPLKTTGYSPLIEGVTDSCFGNFELGGCGENSYFYLAYQGDAAYELLVYDIWGKIVFHSNDPTEMWAGTIKERKPGQESKLPKGTYYYKTHIGEQECTGEIKIFGF